MPVAMLRTTSTLDAMKSEEGNDSLDTFIRQAIGREPVISFPRTGDSPVQWIQLLHALDQQDLPGWPLLSPLKIQMQKCEKCSREFCSQLNYRRHIRVHRRSLKVDKESHKDRDLLGAFWDKLSVDEAKETVAFDDVTLEEVPGSSIIRALASFIRKPGFCTLPQSYVRAGAALLDIIQARPSRLPISSKELFCILDDASERTFLCAGTAETMQKYVFDGEAGKIGLEMKNLIACTSFLLEQKLVKSWLADKDAEALRCQKLLVEEEEAAQKRQVDLLERKRQKKLRQKGQKAKEQANGEKADLEEVTADTLERSPPSERSSLPLTSESTSGTIETVGDHDFLPLEPIQHQIVEDVDIEAQLGISNEHNDSVMGQNVERRNTQGTGRRHSVIPRRQVPKSQRVGQNGFYPSQNQQVLKLEPAQRHSAPRDPRSAPVVNVNKVWTRKSKSGNDGENMESRLQKEAGNEADQSKNCELMIGSISVTLDNHTSQQQGGSLAKTLDDCDKNNVLPNNNGQEKPMKLDSAGTSRSTVKLWRPVSRQGIEGGQMAVQSGSGASGESDNQNVPSESFTRSWDDNGLVHGINADPLPQQTVVPSGVFFSSNAAKVFLAQRWKKAMTADHVKLIISPQAGPPSSADEENDYEAEAPPSDSQKYTNLGDAENLLDNAAVHKSSNTGTDEAMSRTKLEKGVKVKYIPKQRTVT